MVIAKRRLVNLRWYVVLFGAFTNLFYDDGLLIMLYCHVLLYKTSAIRKTTLVRFVKKRKALVISAFLKNIA